MKKKYVFWGIIVLVITFIITLMLGRYQLSLYDMYCLLLYKVANIPVPEDMQTLEIVMWLVHVPRSLMAVLVGASLAVSGAVFQGLFRNPLVSPDILGVSAGAGFGAALAILLVGGSVIAIEFSAFVFALLAVLVAYQIGKRGNSSITTLVLAGVIVSSVFTAGLSFLKYVADPYEQLPAIVFWTMGGFNYIVWADFIRAFPLAFIGMLLIYLLRWQLNPMAMGDEEAMTLGINVHQIRSVYIILATIIVAVSIAACGTIGWVGLVVPHMARMITGPDHKILIPFSAIMGATFMLIMDTLARSMTGAEIPISIITSFIGAPFLAYLLLKQEKNQWKD